MTHQCPGPRCVAEVDSSMLMCPALLVPGTEAGPRGRVAYLEARRRCGYPGAPGGHDRGDSGGEPCLIHSPP